MSVRAGEESFDVSHPRKVRAATTVAKTGESDVCLETRPPSVFVVVILVVVSLLLVFGQRK